MPVGEQRIIANPGKLEALHSDNHDLHLPIRSKVLTPADDRANVRVPGLLTTLTDGTLPFG